VIANGDIIDTKCARQALGQSGADGVMVGRGAQGRPWALAEIAHDIFNEKVPVIPNGNDLTLLISDHYEAMLSFYGVDFGNRVARKHLGWYMDYFGTSAKLRRAILTEKNTKTVLSLIAQLNSDRADAA
jgi:tRNA-dihydrouridine synthase